MSVLEEIDTRTTATAITRTTAIITTTTPYYLTDKCNKI